MNISSSWLVQGFSTLQYLDPLIYTQNSSFHGVSRLTLQTHLRLALKAFKITMHNDCTLKKDDNSNT